MEFVLCIHNDDYPASIEKRKIYRVLPDQKTRVYGSSMHLDIKNGKIWIQINNTELDIGQATEMDQSPFKLIDGFMVLKSQNPLPEIDWVSFVREERINDLM